LFVASGAALLLAAGAGVYAYASRASSNARAALARRAELNREHAPRVGEPAAPVHIVEFIDPACETCAAFYPLVKRLLVEHKGRIRLSMRHVPFHQGADDVVRLLEASRSQDRYWTVLEALLVAQARWAPNHRARLELALPVVAATGLDLPRALAEMGAPEIAQRMRRDLDDAAMLDVTKTPEYFVNGRQMASFGRQQLIALVDDELRRSS
jgi:protein-disulfide isomerase